MEGGGSDLADVALAIELLRAANRLDEAAAWTGRQQQLQTQQMATQYQDKAMAAVNQGNLAVAITWYEAALSVHETPQVRTSLGRVYYDLGRYAEAETQERRAIAVGPGYSPAWYALGEVLAARGDRPGAAAAFRRSMELEPSGFWAAKAKQNVDRLERR
jgi:tetratricopeptide (TPR) repeat protein